MLVLKFFEARRARYILVRDVLARLVSELDCTESEAAGVLRAGLADVGQRSATWFDIAALEVNASPEVLGDDGLSMLEELQNPEPFYDPRITFEELGDRYPNVPGVRNVDLLDHLGFWRPYNDGCFLVSEIEPILRDLIAEMHALAETQSVPAGIAVGADIPIASGTKGRKKRTNLSREDHKEIVQKCEGGRSHEDVAKEYNVRRQTVSGIVKAAKERAATPSLFRRRAITR